MPSSTFEDALRERYLLERELGRGGMATVYLARDLKHDRLVALKVLHPELATVGLERFQREIHFAARLQHPHVLSVYDSGEAAGRLWFTMPFVEGESLRERLRREGQLPIDVALRVAREAAEALGYAHEHGVLHRDIKPENIMLTGDGNTAVADFGIARAIGGEAVERLTATGLSVGTPAYMSPEQAAGAAELDARTDIYALGCVLFEMLTGEPPFTGTTPQSVIAKRFAGPAPSVGALRDTIPPWLDAVVARALSRSPADRFPTASAFAKALSPPAKATGRVTGRSAGRWRWAGLAALLVAGIGAGAAWLASHPQRSPTEGAEWVTGTAIPAISMLADSGHWDSAYHLATRASAILPRDTALERLWPIISDTVTIQSEPESAQVFWKSYVTPAAPGILLGTTPLPAARIPRRLSRIRLEKAGHRPLDLAIWPGFAARAPFVLRSDTTPDDGMVRVAGGETELNLPGLEHMKPLQLGDFLIGRHEVTNKAFKQFVDSGGYRRQELWAHRFTLEGRELGWSEAMARFTDKTGRPGPAGWEAGTYPEGQADHPVTGVSWYEAAAFAAFAGADLPTIYHWSKAAFTRGSSWIVPLSNFTGQGPAPVGRHQAVGPFGTLDMAGNAREWCQNPAGLERYILGGGWNDPTYAFNDAYAQDPFDRSATNGFRLIKDLSDQPAAARRPIVRLFRDFSKERPVSDEVFAAYRRMYDYDRAGLNAVVDTAREETDDWIREKISFDAAYNRERMAAYLYLPKRGKPPYQTIVFFPGSNAIHESSSSKGITVSVFDFIVKSGRAVVHPIYKSTYERQDSLRSDYADMSNFYRDHVIAWAKDFRRSIDYLETRADIDTARVAYYGVSWGGYLGGLIPAVEPRLKAVILLVAGLEFQQGLPEVEPINFLPRIKIPVLMLNGQYDHYFPVETSQRPMFRLLGTPPSRKRQVISEGGHFVPRNQLVQETLDWLDRYLGSLQ
jgi:formylglycine-generating enzyme required for sulfatase activity/dienelactone hydrolase